MIGVTVRLRAGISATVRPRGWATASVDDRAGIKIYRVNFRIRDRGKV